MKFTLFQSPRSQPNLKGVEEQLKRLNYLLEAFLRSQGIITGEEVDPEHAEISYTDPEADFVREMKAALKGEVEEDE